MIDNLIYILNEYSESYLGFKVTAQYATPCDYFKALE